MKRERPVPRVTVDIIIEINQRGIVLIERKNPPHGWALPGGFVDYGESLEKASVREAKEETSLDVELIEQFYTYSDPRRDPRHHTISTVFIARASKAPRGSDDAKRAQIFPENNLPSPLVFDHAQIIKDYFHYKKTCKRPEIHFNAR
ncbi:MAG: NUDIX domain-containing protein [Candidatus Binatia bacterium]